MMNCKILLFYKPVLSLPRLLLRRKINIQLHPNIPRKAISEQILLDIRKTETIWRQHRDSIAFNTHLYQCYVRSSDLITYALDIIHCASNQSCSFSNLVFDIVKNFSNYIDNNNIPFSPTPDQKLDVLASVLNLKNYQIVQLVSKVFKIHEDPVICKKFIDHLIEQKKIVEAAYTVIALHLQNEVDIKKILYPLLMEGHVVTVTMLITNHPDLQLEAIKFLDSYLDQTNLRPVDSILKPRKVFKTLSSLLNTLKISMDHCPNMQFIRSKGAIGILVHRLTEHSISEETWEDMTENIIGDNEDLKKILIQKLIKRKNFKTALKMSEKYNIRDPDLHLTELSNDMSENSNALEEDQSEDFEMAYDLQGIFLDDYLKFSLKVQDIKVIDKKEDFINCIKEISQNYSMIGIDSEWKPKFGLSAERLALIQLAVHDKVFILDVLLLSECLETEDWDKMLDDIFGNPNIIKLGCGIMADVNMILESIKGTKGKAVKFSHILDMVLFYQKLQEVYPVEMKTENEKIFTKSLSSMCDIILGKPLNKTDRLCDWEKRPLQEKQLEYAALDAHCLLQMYDKLKEESVVKNMNFDHLSKVAIVLTTSQWKPKRKFKGVRSGKSFHVHTSIPIDQLKLVMDSSFENQGKKLRELGADVVILQKENSAEEAIEISRTERRIIICSEKLYEQVKHGVKEGFCYCFEKDGEKLQVSHFLQRFNAQVSTKSIFSRCLICNSKDGMKLSSEDLSILHELRKANCSVNTVIKDRLTSFSPELQKNFIDILNSNINIKFSSEGSSSSLNKYAFLCKNCGSIS